MQRSVFVVNDKPYCVWDWNLVELKIEFLNSIDASYFEYLRHVHAEVATDPERHAALALRTAYHHSMEMLFTLLGALAQAPECVYGWVLKCQSDSLTKFVRNINANGGKIFNKLVLDRVTWNDLSDWVHAESSSDANLRAQNIERFGKFWSRLSEEFLDERRIAEYNSIKHGFRLRSGGLTLRVGRENTPGIAVPRAAMKTLSHSPHGSSFYVLQKIESPNLSQGDPNFRGAKISLTWDVEALASALTLISCSINNVVSALKLINGVEESRITFNCPIDAEMFDAPWKSKCDLSHMSFESVIDDSHIQRLSKLEILAELRMESQARNIPPDPQKAS